MPNSLYSHSQTGIIRPLMRIIALALLVSAYFAGDKTGTCILAGAAALCVFISLFFGSLTVSDRIDHLSVFF